MITPQELEIYQQCRAYWHLLKTDNAIEEPVDAYYSAIKKTIFQMYSWRLEKNRLISDKQVRERWDKNWWTASLEQGETPNELILDKAASGWMLLEQYWGEKYIQETELMPLGINFEFSTYILDNHYRIHLDLILAQTDGKYIYRQIGEARTDWELYTSLSTKLEIVSLTNVTLGCPDMKSYIDITSHPTKFVEKKIIVTPKYLKEAQVNIDDVSNAIRNHSNYTSPGPHCKTCRYTGKCWY